MKLVHLALFVISYFLKNLLKYLESSSILLSLSFFFNPVGDG